MLAWLLAHLSQFAIIFAASALAILGAMFALFLWPKLKKIDEFCTSHASLATKFDTLKIPENLTALQRLQTDVAILQSSETQRNETLGSAVHAQNRLIQRLQEEINGKIKAGDQDNLARLLKLRAEQLEIAYTLSRIQGGSKEEETRESLVRAKDELAKLLAEQGKPQ